MCARKGSIGFVVFLVLVIALCWEVPVWAASIPPTIDQIVGTYSVKDNEVYYEFYEGIPHKEKYSLTWHITKLSDSTVQVEIDEWNNWIFTAYYKNGFLVQSSGDVSDPTASWAALGIALFSGKPGKVKFKGDFGWGQFGGVDEYCEWDPFVGKMISTSPTYSVKSTAALTNRDLENQDDEQEVLEAEEEAVPLAAASTLGIDDLPGPYLCSWTSAIYHPTAGTIEKGKLLDLWGITKIDDYTLNITSSWGDVPAHYGTGVLMVGDVDDSVLDTDAHFGILLAKGKPGKISLKGKFYSIVGLGTIDDDFEVAKVSCKQHWP
jgi:hypothetical protein